MTTTSWDRIRGPITWADWRKATPGVTRVRNQHGWEGTVANVFNPKHGHGHISVTWERSGATGVVTDPAYSLTVIA